MVLFFSSFTSLTFLSLHCLVIYSYILAVPLPRRQHHTDTVLYIRIVRRHRLPPLDGADTTASFPLHPFLAFAFRKALALLWTSVGTDMYISYARSHRVHEWSRRTPNSNFLPLPISFPA